MPNAAPKELGLRRAPTISGGVGVSGFISEALGSFNYCRYHLSVLLLHKLPVSQLLETKPSGIAFYLCEMPSGCQIVP